MAKNSTIRVKKADRESMQIEKEPFEMLKT